MSSFDRFAAARPSPLIEVVAAYRAGSVDWPTTRAVLVGRDHAEAETIPTSTSPQWWQAVEDLAAVPAAPDTVRRLHEIADHGGLTLDELAEVETAWETSLDQGDA
jgi:predicted transcriptional regulator